MKLAERIDRVGLIGLIHPAVYVMMGIVDTVVVSWILAYGWETYYHHINGGYHAAAVFTTVVGIAIPFATGIALAATSGVRRG